MDTRTNADPYAIPLDAIDVSNPNLFADGSVAAFFKRLREEQPVHYCADSHYGPYWSVTKYDDIVAVDSNWKTFSADYSNGGHLLGFDIYFPRSEDGEGLSMFIAMDPPKHDAQRKAVTPVVSPANLQELESLIRERCERILDNLPVGETFNWVDRMSIELTTQMLATLFDFPWEDRHLLTRWSDVTVTEPGLGVIETWEEREQALKDCAEYFGRLWAERAKDADDGEKRYDFISLLARSNATNNMTPGEFLGNLVLLIVGGNDTTRNSLTGGVLALNQHPDQYDKLRDNPALIESMVPEIIRWQTPLSHMARIAMEDTELNGAKIKKGDRVVMWYASGNRDEEKIDDPFNFIIDRENPRRHLSFGFGVHRCVGNRLAELQLKIAWEEILKRFRKVEVVGEPVRLPSNIIHGYSELPVRLHPW